MKQKNYLYQIGELTVSDICEFCSVMNLEEEAKEMYGVDDVFDIVRDGGVSDEEAIDSLLWEYGEHLYTIDYIDDKNLGHFYIQFFGVAEKES